MMPRSPAIFLKSAKISPAIFSRSAVDLHRLGGIELEQERCLEGQDQALL